MIELFPLQVYPLTLILFIRGNLAMAELLYSRTSMARTLMTRLPWLFRTLSKTPWKKFF